MKQEEIFSGVAQDIEIMVKDDTIPGRQLLVDRVNDLLQRDFNKLIAILYRVDVNENKLRAMLEENEDREAAEIITDLLIERQVQKIKSREAFKQKEKDISEEEKW